MGWVRDLLKKRDTPASVESPAVELGASRASARQPVSHALRVGRASNVGQVRDHNEDVLLTLEINQLGDQATEPLGWFVLADGMGGHQAGELASAMAMRVVTYELLHEILRPYLFSEAHDASQRPLSEVMVHAVMSASSDASRSFGATSGCRTTSKNASCHWAANAMATDPAPSCAP